MGKKPTHDSREGWEGWEEYALFYDWENRRTLGRADVPFWVRVAAAIRGPVLELGCGTGRVSIPLARAGVRVVGVDRSASMLARAGQRARALAYRRPGRPRGRLRLVRADIRALPFPDASFAAVLAPYGILQSLLNDRDLARALDAAARVIEPGGTFGIDLVPDVPDWREYHRKVRHRGRAPGGAHLTLVESVRQDRAHRMTTFEQTYIERRGAARRVHRFELVFRSLSIRQMAGRLARAGFDVEAVLGDYCGGPWDTRAQTWILLARRRSVRRAL